MFVRSLPAWQRQALIAAGSHKFMTGQDRVLYRQVVSMMKVRGLCARSTFWIDLNVPGLVRTALLGQGPTPLGKPRS